MINKPSITRLTGLTTIHIMKHVWIQMIIILQPNCRRMNDNYMAVLKQLALTEQSNFATS